MDQAKTEMMSRLNGVAAKGQRLEEAGVRKNQVGSGERGDKIRTYRFQDNTVKDHQTGKQAACDRVMAGNFQLVW